MTLRKRQSGDRLGVRRVFAVGATAPPGLVALVLVATAVTAVAAWSAEASGPALGAALTMPSGNTPTATASGTAVEVAWTASTFATGVAIAGYVVRRYDLTGAAQTIGAGCEGVIAATSCTETSVPTGTWQYTVTPVQQKWTGSESAGSAAVSI